MARAWRKPPWPGRTTLLSRPPAALITFSQPAFTSYSRGLYATLGTAAVRMSGLLYPATAAASCTASLTTSGAVSSRQTTLWPAANRYGLQCSYALLTASPRMCWGTESHPAKLCCPPAYWLYGEATAATGSTSAATYMAAATASCLAGTVSTTAAANSSCGSSSGFTTSCTAAASNLFGPGRASPLTLYAAEATALGWLSRSAPSSALCSALCSTPSSRLCSAPRSSSLLFPPTPICCEAASASEADSYTAAARIEPGRGCSDAQGMRVDQPASISFTSTAGQAPPQYDTTEDGTHGMAASYEHCRTAVPSPNYTEARAGRSSNETSDPASLSQARTVTLRYCDSFS